MKKGSETQTSPFSSAFTVTSLGLRFFPFLSTLVKSPLTFTFFAYSSWVVWSEILYKLGEDLEELNLIRV